MVGTPHDWIGVTLSGGRYRISARLGEGGMGSVYKAHDQNLDTDVVIKVPHPYLLHDPQFAHRFQREIRSLVRLSHPNIVTILDVGEYDGVPFAVMSCLSGGDLEDRRHRDAVGATLPMAPSTLAEWLPAVAKALDYVHRQGYVHRDIKPANILFDDDGNPYVSDFGIAKVLAESRNAGTAALTGTGLVLGTPEYMAPELVMGSRATVPLDRNGHECDCLGCVACVLERIGSGERTRSPHWAGTTFDTID